MPTFSAMRSSFTPAVWSLSSNPNWALDASVSLNGLFGKIVMINWGGSGTTSTGYLTRWVRPTTAGTGARTAITIAASQPNYATNGLLPLSVYATSQPIVPAVSVGDLWSQAWNVQGGVGVIVLPLANPWWISGGILQGAIECQNVSGVDAALSSYGVEWEE